MVSWSNLLRVRETLRPTEDIIGDLGAVILFLTNRTRQQYQLLMKKTQMMVNQNQRRKTTVNVEAAVIAEERRFMCVKRIRRRANSYVTSVRFTCREVILQILWERLRRNLRRDYSRNSAAVRATETWNRIQMRGKTIQNLK